MPAPITSRRLLPPVAFLLLLISALLPARYSLHVPPLYNAMHLLLSPVSSRLQAFGSRLHDRPLSEARTTEQLRDELLLQGGDLKRANEEVLRLREQLAMLTTLRKQGGGKWDQPLLARVLARSTDPGSQTLTLDAGLRDGLDVGMVVVDAGAAGQGGPQLVGRIVQVQSATCVVGLISAPGSVLRLRIGPATEGWTLFRATHAGTLVATDAKRDLPVSIGDPAWLTDDEGPDPWPPIAQFTLAGTVTSIQPDPNEPLLTRIEVTPLRSLRSLRQVVIYIPKEEGAQK